MLSDTLNINLAKNALLVDQIDRSQNPSLERSSSNPSSATVTKEKDLRQTLRFQQDGETMRLWHLQV